MKLVRLLTQFNKEFTLKFKKYINFYGSNCVAFTALYRINSGSC